jgi:hypothetical protein
MTRPLRERESEPSSLALFLAAIAVGGVLVGVVQVVASLASPDAETMRAWEEGLSHARERLDEVLGIGIGWKILILAALVLVGVAWPRARLVSRFTRGESWGKFVLVVLTVLTSFTFFGAEYVHACEPTWVLRLHDSEAHRQLAADESKARRELIAIAELDREARVNPAALRNTLAKVAPPPPSGSVDVVALAQKVAQAAPREPPPDAPFPAAGINSPTGGGSTSGESFAAAVAEDREARARVDRLSAAVEQMREAFVDVLTQAVTTAVLERVHVAGDMTKLFVETLVEQVAEACNEHVGVDDADSARDWVKTHAARWAWSPPSRAEAAPKVVAVTNAPNPALQTPANDRGSEAETPSSPSTAIPKRQRWTTPETPLPQLPSVPTQLPQGPPLPPPRPPPFDVPTVHFVP